MPVIDTPTKHHTGVASDPEAGSYVLGGVSDRAVLVWCELECGESRWEKMTGGIRLKWKRH